jgi:1-acyl-sn-glycerol-3-phosphate acyltransferase
MALPTPATQRNIQAVQDKTPYHAGKLLVRLLLRCVTRVRILRRENTDRTGGFLLVANHISHFDPFRQ